ncbi:TetR/AcrR family transcriptional regulator [Caproiciproducens galactitolivorans]|uniref:TetR/AcrR family transcriptional regulator n=1 Tax=Caproiciproducens galactitolivorans TaxID=642589 RepID=A0ABT4BP87_9FIRM|nr:TetR/AcrR family transcriptional regulator [Caproiciproducens galactitolivorans]MCY1712697.1 TetR/AcrR family transcriptional regulator [Caproiciproducens galactitolivorans]
MPKIIKNVDQTIRECARELFIQSSFNDVDMQMISKKSGIAVGTLYHYYVSKKQLYISILNESWESTFRRLDAVNHSDLPSKEKLRRFLCTLYDDIEARNGIGKVILNSSADVFRDDKEVQDIKNSLFLKTKTLFQSFKKIETFGNCDAKLAETLIVSVLTMLEFYPNDKNGNIDYLSNYFNLTIL